MHDVLETAQKIKHEVIKFRRELHQIPEFAFDLEKTTEKVQHCLQEMGIESTKCGKAGIVAVIDGENTDGPVFGIRADMDGMPVQEETGLDFVSKHEGYMHCCGHDAHTAILLGAAKLLIENRQEWNGRVKLIFQPAEETGKGALDIIDGGALKKPDVDIMLGLHIWQPLESGKVGIKEGAFMASADGFSISIHGKASHGAMPHQGIDAIAAAADFIHGIQHVLSRVVPSDEIYVLSFGKINGGVKDTIIAEEVIIEGTYRTFNTKVRDLIDRKIREFLDSKALAYGIEWEYKWKFTAQPTINDSVLAKKVKNAIIKAIGNDRVIEYGPVMPSEDFSEYGKHVPAVFFFLGGGNEKYTYSHHHPKFDIDEEALPFGVASFVGSVIELTKK